MYFKDIETDTAAAKARNDLQKKMASERLAKNAAWNKAHKSKD